MKLEERKDKASELRRRGYNCAQAVLMAVTDLTGLSDEMAAEVAAGLGGGVGGQGEICGAVSAMAIAVGLIEKKDPKQKGEVYATVRQLSDEFRKRNDGRIVCRELKAPGAPRPCNILIEDCIEILHNKYYC